MAGRGRALRPPLSAGAGGGPAGVDGRPPLSAGGGGGPAGVDARPPLKTPRVESYRELAARIAALRPAGGLRTRVVAVDGRGAAGKTTFSGRLAAALGGAPVVHTDDVVARVGSPWWPTLEAEVLVPLAETGPEVLLIEGVSASRRAITARLAYGIWMEAPTGRRLARGIARDGAGAAAEWARYEDEETAFFAADPAWERADLVVDGAPDLAHSAETEYVRLR